MPRSRGLSRGSHPKSLNSIATPKGRGSSSIVGRGGEIGDEWRPRGTGSNNTSGNGRDVRDECSPRGRGSNNTCGNGRDKADECSPRGGGSNSVGGRGNETADESCPSPNILSNETLDVQEDNEEHVEHVTDSSQNQAGSNAIPSSSLPKLWLIGGV